MVYFGTTYPFLRTSPGHPLWYSYLVHMINYFSLVISLSLLKQDTLINESILTFVERNTF